MQVSLRCILLLACAFIGYRSAGQEPLCACLSAWQRGATAPPQCPHTDSAGQYDRTAKSYVLYLGNEVSAQEKLKEVVASIKACDGVGAAYQLHTDYDQVQMNDVYTFLPLASPSKAGQPVVAPAKMVLSLKSRPSAAAVLLKITGTAAIPGGEAAFITATQKLLTEWRAALSGKKIFTAPERGWASQYPAARYAGSDAAVGKYETGIVYRYEWRAATGESEALQQSLMGALSKIPDVMGNGSPYNAVLPGKSSVMGYRLMPPNPQIRIETAIDFTEQAGTVRLSIIVPDGKKDR